MVDRINDSSLAYSPVSRFPTVNRLPVEKELPSQSARPINYSQSTVNNVNSQSIVTESSKNQYSSVVSSSTNSELVKQEEQVQQVINQLKARDAEVRAHEMAHFSAAGMYATGGMSLSYQKGPDGRQYAIGGEVGIDLSVVPGDPEATLAKARTIQQAAMAPAEPSGQDRKVASAAAQMMVQAQAEIVKKSQEIREIDEQNEAEKAKKLEEAPLNEERSQMIKAGWETFGLDTLKESKEALPATAAVVESSDRVQFDLRLQVASYR